MTNTPTLTIHQQRDRTIEALRDIARQSRDPKGLADSLINAADLLELAYKRTDETDIIVLELGNVVKGLLDVIGMNEVESVKLARDVIGKLEVTLSRSPGGMQ